MAERWKKVDNRNYLEKEILIAPEEVVYNVTEKVIVRSVQRNGLELEKSRLMDRIAEIDADLAKIEELQAAKGTA